MATNFGHQTASGHLTVPAESKEPYAADVLEQLHRDAEQVIARYPQKRSALLPLLHLVQSVDGYVTGRGINFCAEVLDLTRAEVSGVATFYTQYKRHPNGEYTVGVCTNTLCAIMGGDEIWEAVSEHLGVGHDETTPDGKITLERVECNAACDFAPVVMANWEFFDNQTPESTKQLVDDLRAGKSVKPSRGPSTVCTFKQVSRVLAGFHDGLADEGVGAGPASLEGLRVARANNWTAPDGAPRQEHRAEATSAEMAPGRHTSTNAPTNEPDELPGGEDATASDDVEAETTEEGK
jgi:NADH-quinone oxidoreductase subunit E